MKWITGLQGHSSRGEPADANFRALQIGKNADVPPLMLRLTTNVLRYQCMIRLGTVTEVQPKHIHPRAE